MKKDEGGILENNEELNENEQQNIENETVEDVVIDSKNDIENIVDTQNAENNIIQEESKEDDLKKDEMSDSIVSETDKDEKLDNKLKENKQLNNNELNKNNEQEFKRVEVKHNKNKKKAIIFAVSILMIVILVMIFSIIFSILNINNTKILKNISVLGIDVSDLSVDEAKQRINDAIEHKFNNENDSISLKRGDLKTSINANTVNAKFDVESALVDAYNTGRSGNIITNNYEILWTQIFGKKIEPQLYYDESFMNSTIDDINSKMTDKVVEYSYFIEGKKLIVSKGKAGYTIKRQELTQQIVNELKNIHSPYQEIEIPVDYKEPEEINLEKIRNEIYKEPKDAYVEKNPTVVHVEENGIDFEISLEEAKKLLQEDKKEYEIPLKITAPKKKISDLGEEAFPDMLSTFSTIYDASAYNRAANIELAAKKINGTVIMPGEIFSYNKVVGSRTIEEGFKEGTAYVGGKIVPSVGGGVCQVSSTLYNTALLANLQITERKNHMFTAGYVAESRDATVYYGSLDFCFKNTRTYPVKVVANAKNGVCKVSLYGIKEKVEYEVIIQSKVTSYINFTTTYKQDPTLPEGKEVVEQAGFNGCRSEGYRILKLNGKVVSQTLLSKDTYQPQERIVRRGTKKVVAPQPATQTTTSQDEIQTVTE